MPFEKIDPEKKIQKKLQADPEFAKAYFEAETEFEIIKELVRKRKELEVTQKELAEAACIQQQIVSRMERGTHSPTLRSFLKIVTALGMEIRLVKKETTAALVYNIPQNFQYKFEAACCKENPDDKEGSNYQPLLKEA